ncbi:MAG: hypothetical protein IJ308_08440 [Clostridia bacterium]|nr:hypothetical protein [Clostridia bacterium]
MARKGKEMTNEELLTEIERLKKSPYVKLGREQMRLKQQLYNLRHLEKIGKQVQVNNESNQN